MFRKHTHIEIINQRTKAMVMWTSFGFIGKERKPVLYHSPLWFVVTESGDIKIASVCRGRFRSNSGQCIEAGKRIRAPVNYAIICHDNGLSPVWRQAIILNNIGLLLIGQLGPNLSRPQCVEAAVMVLIYFSRRFLNDILNRVVPCVELPPIILRVDPQMNMPLWKYFVNTC